MPCRAKPAIPSCTRSYCACPNQATLYLPYRSDLAAPSPTMPYLPCRATSCRAKPAVPSRAPPYHTLACRALQCLACRAEQHYAYPDCAELSSAVPALLRRALLCLGLPRRACHVEPNPRRTQPAHAWLCLPCLPCLTLPCRVEPFLSGPSFACRALPGCALLCEAPAIRT